MKLSDVRDIQRVQRLLPHLVICGKLACRVQDALIQKRVMAAEPAQKSGDRFTQALSDADLIIEGYLGTAIQAEFPDAAFFGEEGDKDLVSRYLPKSGHLLILLDPVDGTLFFKDGLPIFSTILTICRDGKIVAGVMYLPRSEKFFLAFAGQGAWTTTAAGIQSGREWLPYTIPINPQQTSILLEPASRTETFVKAGFKTESFAAYNRQSDWKLTSYSVLTGGVCGMVREKGAQLMDAGVIAFMVSEAGGRWNNPVFSPQEHLSCGPLVAAGSDRVFERLVRLI